jgi:hypothetical protein
MNLPRQGVSLLLIEWKWQNFGGAKFCGKFLNENFADADFNFSFCHVFLCVDPGTIS